MEPPTAGVDGCRGGWIVVHNRCAATYRTFAEVLAALPGDTVIALDMPIGLLQEHRPGGRECDRAARAVLGRARASSVFSPPPRCALGARTLAEARDRGARLTLQALNLLPKIEEVDAGMSPALQERVFETHPELAFAARNGGAPVATSKRSAEGRAVRLGLLDNGVPTRPPRAAVDDLLDACVLAWSAVRIASGSHRRVPADPPLDGRGLRMEICW